MCEPSLTSIDACPRPELPAFPHSDRHLGLASTPCSQVASCSAAFAADIVDSLRVLVCQSRRSAAVAAFLSVAMVAGVALTYFQPNVELLAEGGSPHSDAELALELIRAAPHASVCQSRLTTIQVPVKSLVNILKQAQSHFASLWNSNT